MADPRPLSEKPSELAPPPPTGRFRPSLGMALPAVLFLAGVGGGEAAGGWEIPVAIESPLEVGILGSSLLAALAGTTIRFREVSLAQTDVASSRRAT